MLAVDQNLDLDNWVCVLNFLHVMLYAFLFFFQKNLQVSNNLDPHQERHCVGPDLGPNCLLKLSADNKSPLARKE